MKQKLKDTGIIVLILTVFICILLIHPTNSKYACDTINTEYVIKVDYLKHPSDTLKLYEPKGVFTVDTITRNNVYGQRIVVKDKTEKIVLWAQEYIGATNITLLNRTND